MKEITCWTATLFNVMHESLAPCFHSPCVSWLTGWPIRGSGMGVQAPLSSWPGTKGSAGYSWMRPDLSLSMTRSWRVVGPQPLNQPGTKGNVESPIGSTRYATPRRGHWLGWLVRVEARRASPKCTPPKWIG